MIKILIVDDEAEICEFIGNFFKRRSHTVFTVTNPLEVMPIIEKERPQIVLLDIIMDEMSGIDLLEKIKAIDKNIRVIMITVVDDLPVKEKAKSLGADAYVEKPFTTDYLETVVMTKIEDLLGFSKET